MRVLLLLICLSVSVGSMAQECPHDFSNTSPSAPDHYSNAGLDSFEWCFNCRELNSFPQDVVNQAWNYISGSGDVAFVYRSRYGSLSHDIGDSSLLVLRICNGLRL